MALKYLTETAEFVSGDKGIPESVKDNLEVKISSIISYVTRVSSLISYGNWSPRDPIVILENGNQGYTAISAKYRNSPSRFVTEMPDFLKLFEEYLEGPRFNRVEISELLRLTVIKSSKIDYLRNLTESLNMGEISWEEYVPLAKEQVAYL